ncbi:MAG: glycosyl transferase family 2 [Bacteroidetes bacterium]|jgi:glycosyltransferase involved in cell wall biosynthesis|nr:glycosyl transferase family 2 [Bacteroidota bacterium]
MKISVITTTFNSASTIEDTLKSVIEQDHADIEYIIIDGLSKDNTLEIVSRYKDRIAKIISEKDKGIYDALNKGIQAASGDVIALLHSDDFYIDKNVLSKVARAFENANTDSVYGDLYYVDKDDTNKIVRKWISGKYKAGMFLNGWMPPHPAFFVRRSVYEKYGLFNLQFRSAADYELMLRFLHKYKISTAYINEYLVKMRTGGQSNASVKNRVKANQEDREAWVVNGLKPRFYTLTFKPLRKIIQFIR